MKLRLLSEDSPTATLQRMLPELAKAAQLVYDSWQQDEEGYDEDLGYGGICQDIADAVEIEILIPL